MKGKDCAFKGCNTSDVNCIYEACTPARLYVIHMSALMEKEKVKTYF